MKSNVHEVVMIETSKLIAHPANANVMSPDVMKKLKRHIQNSGRYEPLVVRPHPTRPKHFELINGHHRKLILEQLHKKHAACVVWHLSDAETLMLLATVNRLSGKDAAGKRLSLLEILGEKMSIKELAGFLPEEENILRAALETDETLAMHDPQPLGEMEESFTIFLKAKEKHRLVTALKKETNDLAKALMAWVNHFENP